jgi:hypothetical protein
VAFACGTILSPCDAEAVRPYRCGGKIQFTPCPHYSPIDEISAERAPRKDSEPATDPLWKIRGKRFAEVSKTSFSKVDRSQGIWSGQLKGNGLVETELQIYRDNKLEERRYMGHIWLDNKKTPFRFKSALPPGKNWQWRVVAWAR